MQKALGRLSAEDAEAVGQRHGLQRRTEVMGCSHERPWLAVRAGDKREESMAAPATKRSV